MLLPIRHKVEPVFDNLAEGHKTSPAIEHLWLEVVIASVPVLPAANRFRQKVKSFVLGVVCDVLHLNRRESFVLHEIPEVSDVHLFVKHLLYDRSNLVNFEHSLGKLGLLLPHVESIANLRRDEVTKHDLFLLHDDLISMGLPTHVSVVLK